MSGESSSADAGAPKLNLTAEEKHVYGQLFRQADTEGVGVVTGEIAVKFFDKTRLDSRVLGEIWQIADRENRGFLTPAGFGVVLRLIGHAQAGREPSPEIALQQGPIPRFDGFNPTPLPTLPNPLPGPPPGPPPPLQGLQTQGTGSTPIRIPPLTPEKVAQYATIFERQALQNGNMLPGEQAKQIFEKSGLPNEVLGRIWMLADTEQRGALVQTEFVIAMHLLSSLKTGVLRGLPNILPAALYEAATRRAPVGGPIARQQTSSPTTAAPMSAIPRQLSGQAPLAQMRTGSPLGRPSMAPQTTGSDWLITPTDKGRFDLLYAQLDQTNKGYITGEEAVPFFSQSNLPENTLAQIWDLADLRSEGRLNKDLFAVAMYLIRQQRSNKSGLNTLPASLPPNLIPPGMRNNQVRAPATTASPFDAPPLGTASAPPRAAVPPPKPSALDDLFGLDSPQPSAPAQIPLATGGSAAANDPFSTSSSPPAPLSPIRPSATGTQFKPFVPSSSFGRNLLPQGTGGSSSSVPAASRAQPLPAAVEDDLLGDNDPEISSKLNNETTELANLSNQIGSLSKQMHDVQGKRTSMQNELNQASAQKKNFEQRLAQLRSAYEKEAQDVRALETQLSNARSETKKLQVEMAMMEGAHQDLQNQHGQVLAALQEDQQENASLKERIQAVNGEIAQLKPQIEKLKSEARQQKGLVAINKKQLSTNEGEREKLKTEVADLTKSNEELARQVRTSSPPPAQVASPALSTTSANNPFFRRTGSTDIAGAFASPNLKAFNDRSFDDVFGPSPFPPIGETSTPSPPNAFKPQTTGTSTTSVTSGSFATPTSTSPHMSRQGTLAVEPPAVPESSQITSNYVPFTDAQESVSSSRQISPPLGRLSQTDTPSAEAQSTPIASPAEASRTGINPAPGSSEPDAARATTVSHATENNNTAASDGTDRLDGGWWGGKSKEGGEGGVIAAAGHAAESLLHAATGVKDTIFGSSDNSAKAPSKENSTSDAFPPVDQAKAKEDFDSAFASFKTARAKAPATDIPKPFSTSHSEFPPISELEHDDESDSDSDRGFDDDFAPASPPPKSADLKSTASKPSSPELPKSFPAETSQSPHAGFAAPAESDQPASPAPAPATAAASHQSHLRESSVDDIFGTSASNLPVPSLTHAPAPSAGSKSAFDDLDDEFDDLEDAKEGSADDDFANISRSGLDDFNPVFDSSPPQSQAAKSDSANTNAKHGAESSFDFGSLSTDSTAGSTTVATGAAAVPSQTAAAGKIQNPSDPHDWDAIFSSLDDTPSAAAPSSPPPPAAPGSVPVAAPTTTGNSNLKEPVVRPTGPGRALTEVGEHDDPILKNLTGMGYSRADALSALEKYDYNLERAANFLASQS